MASEGDYVSIPVTRGQLLKHLGGVPEARALERQGVKVIWQSQDPDDRCAFFAREDGEVMTVVCNPRRPPQIVHPDGRVQQLEWFD